MKTTEHIPNTDVLDFMSEPCAVFDSDLIYVYVNIAYTHLVGRPAKDLIGKYLFKAFPETPERIEIVQSTMDKCLSGVASELDNLSYEIELEDGSKSEKIWKICQDPIKNKQGDVTHILQRALDITEQVIAEQQNAAISREINHRAKNTMAVVTAITRISSRNATDLESFLSSFTSRIDAMSRTHDKLNTNNWQGLSIAEAFETELQQYVSEHGAEYALKGPKILLSVSGTKDLALVTHELLTNAVKYGCFYGEGGRLDISWKRIKDGVEIRWAETCTHAIKASETEGFGSRLFGLLPHIDVTQTYETHGLQTHIRITGDIAFV
jgi:PAS domain S-box-containing protein